MRTDVAVEMCDIHPFEVADDRCGDCGRPFCSECVVYAFGPKKPPLCRACAITRSGVRKNAARTPVASKRKIRREAKARRREARRGPKDDVEVQAGSTEWQEPPAAEQPMPAPPPPAPRPEFEPAVVTTGGSEGQMAAAEGAPQPVEQAGNTLIDQLPYDTDDGPEPDARPSFENRLTRRRL